MIKSVKADQLVGQELVRHAFYTRQGGVSKGSYSSLNCSFTNDDDLNHIVENRKRVAEDFGIDPDNLVMCRQIHSADIMVVDKPWSMDDSPEADGLVTNKRGVALGVLSADCVPVLLSDYKTGVIGAVHAGWRGALSGVVEQAVEAMVGLGAVKESIVGALGPCIWQDHYEVDIQMMIQFTDRDVNDRRFFIESEKENHYMFDLPGYVRSRALSAGISDCALPAYDTYAEPEDFFSCRRNFHNDAGEHGAQVSVIMLSE